jgi:hypothetical protein
MQANGASKWAEQKIELQSIFESSFQDLPLFSFVARFLFCLHSLLCLLIERLFMPLSKRQDIQMIR